MDNFKFLQGYEQLQYTIMFDKFIDLDHSVISYCQNDNSAYWNHALTNRIINYNQLSEIEKTLQGLKRKPAVYFENNHSLEPLVDLLKTNSYTFSFEDSWMFWQKKKIDTDNFNQVKKVTNKKELEIYLTTFNACYQKDDPQNVYGELGNYLVVAKDSWYRHSESNRIEYYMVYKNDNPVAVSALTNYHGIGYVSNVGSLKNVRGEGFGKLATLYCVYRSQKNNNSTTCLATEEKTYPNEFYKRIGFKTLFTAVCYSK